MFFLHKVLNLVGSYLRNGLSLYPLGEVINGTPGTSSDELLVGNGPGYQFPMCGKAMGCGLIGTPLGCMMPIGVLLPLFSPLCILHAVFSHGRSIILCSKNIQ